MKILFLNHKESHCGIHQFGANIWDAIQEYDTVSSPIEFHNLLDDCSPDVILFNFFPSTMPWLSDDLTKGLRTVGICHEHSQIEALRTKFDRIIFPDPTLPSDNFLFTTGRLVPEYDPKPPPEKLTIGTFGFGFGNKGNYRLVDRVQEEFDEAHIRLHMSFAAFGDGDGQQALYWADECRKRITKPGITLEVVHEFMPSTEDVLDFLSGHTINAFFYDMMAARGISSTIDYALAVHRPIAISDSNMFDHIRHLPIVVPGHSLKEIIEQGDIFQDLREQWSPKNLVGRYETIISTL